MADQIKELLANIFISDIYLSGAGLVTITDIKLTEDLKIAKIFISFLNNDKKNEDLLKEIISRRKIIRHLLGLKLSLRYIPELRFYYDHSTEYAAKINKLINKINQ